MARRLLIDLCDLPDLGEEPRVEIPPVETPEDPAPIEMVGFDMDETTVLGPPPARTARGWAYRANQALAPRGKTLLDTHGRMRFSRAQFLHVSRDVLRILSAYEVVNDPSRIPWGSFQGETPTGDQETDWELLRSWLEDR